MNTLPVEVSFVDENDTVQYFNKNGDRVFPRPRTIIGRKIQNCHPRKSVHIVNQLLDEMKAGKRDVAKFWIDVKGWKIYIRYFAVRGENKKYLGCLEVSQDITDVKKLKAKKNS